LDAGVSEDGTWTECDEGTPQGASISTLWRTSTCYVFDLWPTGGDACARGDMVVTRFADDCVPRTLKEVSM